MFHIGFIIESPFVCLDQKDLGCLVTLNIDRIQFPIQLATRSGNDRLDDRTSLFVQYRFYDKSMCFEFYHINRIQT
jgi:hypothetical protein